MFVLVEICEAEERLKALFPEKTEPKRDLTELLSDLQKQVDHIELFQLKQKIHCQLCVIVIVMVDKSKLWIGSACFFFSPAHNSTKLKPLTQCLEIVQLQSVGLRFTSYSQRSAVTINKSVIFA